MQTVSALACGKQIKRDCCSRIGEDFGSLIRNRCDHAVRYLTMQRAHIVTEFMKEAAGRRAFFTFFKKNLTYFA